MNNLLKNKQWINSYVRDSIYIFKRTVNRIILPRDLNITKQKKLKIKKKKGREAYLWGMGKRIKLQIIKFLFFTENDLQNLY